jgi:hypothetical protein
MLPSTFQDARMLFARFQRVITGMLAIPATLLLLLGCAGGGPNNPPPTPAAVSAVTISPKTVTLKPGDSQQFSATVSGAGAFNTAITWTCGGGTLSSSSNPTTWTAPYTPGAYWVEARSSQDPNKGDLAIVTVAAANPVTIHAFTASPTTISAGQSVLLTPIFTNATSASIDNGVGTVFSGAAYTRTPTATTTYTLTANGPGGPVSRSVTVTVTQGNPVAINSFTASPTSITAGQSVLLTPWFTNATSASIDNGVGTVVSGAAYTQTPSATTTYTLTAYGAGGPVSRSVTVTVTQGNPVAINSFTASPTSTTAGQSVLLTPWFTNATSASIDNGVGTVVSGAAYTQTPSATTTYTLTAYGAGGPVSRSTTVTVNSANPPGSYGSQYFPMSPGNTWRYESTVSPGVTMVQTLLVLSADSQNSVVQLTLNQGNGDSRQNMEYKIINSNMYLKSVHTDNCGEAIVFNSNWPIYLPDSSYGNNFSCAIIEQLNPPCWPSSQIQIQEDGHIVGTEMITTPAGTFSAVRIDLVHSEQGFTIDLIYYYVKNIGKIKTIEKSHDTGAVLWEENLVSYFVK